MGRRDSYGDRESQECDPEKCLKACREARAADETTGAGRKARLCQKEVDNQALLDAASKLCGTGLEACFQYARRGSELNPKDTNLLGMLRRMETAANERLNESRGCESVGDALQISGAGTNVNGKALEIGKELGCPLPGR